MSDFIPVNEPLLNGNEKKYLNECIDTGWISSEGPFVRKFEQLMAARMERKYAIAVTNGTSALDLAIAALDIKKDDEIILPTFTIISCIHQIIRIGAKPVLVDSDPLTWNMNTEQIEAKITKKTKAIMVVHIYGLPVNMNPVLELAKKYNLRIIEDAAEMHGQVYYNRPCGSFGDISTLSFYPNKHITTGEGGMVLTNDSELAEKCRYMRNLCFKPQQRFVHEHLGWNMRMTNIQAAIGVAQLERLDEFINKKRSIGQLYTKLLSNLENFIQLPLPKTDYATNIYWVYGLVLKKEATHHNAPIIMERLKQNGVGTRPFFYPMHKQPVLTQMGFFQNQDFPIAENLAQNGFYIPSGLGITEAQINFVSQKIKEVFTK